MTPVAPVMNMRMGSSSLLIPAAEDGPTISW